MAAVIAIIIYGVRSGSKGSHDSSKNASSGSSANKKSRGNVDKIFWQRLSKLSKIVLPSMKSREARYIYLLTILLVARTLMSIWLADVNGKVVKAIVNKSFSEFLKRVSDSFAFFLKKKSFLKLNNILT